MRILFIDPPFQRFMGFYRYYYPLGLASMAAVLRQAGHEVLVYDADHTESAETDCLRWRDSRTGTGRRYATTPPASPSRTWIRCPSPPLTH